MKRIFYLSIILLATQQAVSQSISESKDNINSILLNGSAITLKITDPSLKLDFQKNRLFKEDRNNGYILGISAEGKNQNNVATIFKGGDFVPSGKIVGLAGITFTNNIVKSPQQVREEIRVKERSIREQLEKLILIKEQLEKAWQDVTAITTAINNLTSNELIPILNAGANAANEYSKKSFYKIAIFTYGGISAKSFKHFVTYDPNELLKSFKNENFRGGFGGVGLNYQYRNWQFGTIWSYTGDDNQSLLAEKTFNYEKVTTSNNQTIKETKEIKAFVGEYSKINYFSLNVDVISNLSLDHIKSSEQPRNYMLLNPYLHSKIGSSNRELLPNTIDIGLGLYVFNAKSKILGGLFIELPDYADKIEKSKIAADRNIRPALQKLSFGIVTRFNLQSFMKFQDL